MVSFCFPKKRAYGFRIRFVFLEPAPSADWFAEKATLPLPRLILTEKVRVRSGSHQGQFSRLQSIDQHPIGVNVAISMVFPLSGQRVVEVVFRQGEVLGQFFDDLKQFFDRVSTRLGQFFEIALEL